jgi:hypothetical protein
LKACSRTTSELETTAPEIGWAFVLGLVSVVPAELLGHVGGAELEDFCWAAADEYVDRIVEQAPSDPRFRVALGPVWPGGKAISP